MLAQLESVPAELHWSHWYLNSVGVLVHVPETSLSCTSWRASPVISGAFVDPGTGKVLITALGSLVAGSLSPPEFLAISLTRSLWLTSLNEAVYSLLVAPSMTSQLESVPSELHRSHWYLN